jgi:hypothetical protein
MNLEVLSLRKRVEDQEVVTEDTRTDEFIVDMGTKALPGNPLVKHRGIVNGYSLVKAAHPNKQVSECVHD